MTTPVDGWTKARYWSFIRSALRSAFRRYPNKYKALAEAKQKLKTKKGRQQYEYKCNSCLQSFPAKEVCVDHIIPCGSLKDYTDLPAFVENLYCDTRGLQVLCKECHRIKTNEERKKK